MRRKTVSIFLIATLLLVQSFAIISQKSFVAGSDDIEAAASQSGLINVALTNNVAPQSDWSNGTLYSLRILQKFIPINITIITDFATLSDYQVLFLNMLNISDADIMTIANWVNDGGFLVCIGQSGRYNEMGEERTSHPLATVLGIVLDGWERTSGAEVRKLIMNVTWYWWSSGRVYDTANNGDGLYHEEADIYYIPQSECVNATLNGATQIMSCRDKDDSYEEPFLTRNGYGSGMAFFIAADAFCRLMWRPPNENYGIFRNENVLVGGYWFRSGLLWQILYAIVLDYFPSLPLCIFTSMPNGYYTAMSWGLKTTGWGSSDPDILDDFVYANLTQYWKPQLFDSQPTLKGWFWGFWLLTDNIDGTSNASNIVDFVKEYGYAGSRGEGNLTLAYFTESSEILRNNGFMYNYEGSAGGTVAIQDLATLVRKWNFTDIFYLRRISGRAEHGAEISCIPCLICNDTGIVNFFAHPYAVETGGSAIEWRLLIQNQKVLGENYGIGGYCMGDTYDAWIGSIPNMIETINAFINDGTVWKTSGQIFVDWWDKRWQVNMTDFSSNSTQMTIALQTPDIQNLTLLIRERPEFYRSITIDGTPLATLPDSDKIVIPQLSQGVHNIVIKFATIFSTPELKEYNNQLKAGGRPYVVDSTHLIEYLNYAHQRLSLTLNLPIDATAELKVYSLYPPRQVFADGQQINLTYSNITHIATMLTSQTHVDMYYTQPEISRFSSAKLEYRTGEDVSLTLEVYGNQSTSEAVKWLTRVTVLDETENIVNITDQEIEISTAVSKILYFVVKNLSQGTYTVTAKILDPEIPQNVFAMDSLTVNITEIPTEQQIFDTVELREYNDELKSENLPYVQECTQTIVDLAFSNNYQRLSITLNAQSGINTELKVYSLYPPHQVFANGQPVSFTYNNITHIATILTSQLHVDIYYVQPRITEFTSSKTSYEPSEDVEVDLKVYGDYFASEVIRWPIWFAIKNGTGDIVKWVNQEIELNTTQNITLHVVAGRFSEGNYTITAEIIDPEAENILETSSSTIKVMPVSPPSQIIVMTSIVAVLGAIVAFYAWHRWKKPKMRSNHKQVFSLAILK
jgi:hypothetical protein